MSNDPTYSQIDAAIIAMYPALPPKHITQADRDAMKRALIAAQGVDPNVYGDMHYGVGLDGVRYMCNSVEAQRKIMEWQHTAVHRLPYFERLAGDLKAQLQEAEGVIAAGEGILKTEIETRERLGREVTALRRNAVDHAYMLAALIPMLGEKARQVLQAWQDKGVKRLHVDWVVDPMTMEGEEVAQHHLNMEKAVKNSVPLTDEELRNF